MFFKQVPFKEPEVSAQKANVLPFLSFTASAFPVKRKCWIRSCCEWEKRQEDDICGLDNSKLSVLEKMKRIYAGSSLKTQFPKVGLLIGNR